MAKSTHNIFYRKNDKLLEMLSLRNSGWTFASLAELYKCDRASLRYQCRKYQVFPKKKRFIFNSKEVFNPKRIYIQVISELFPQKVSNWVVVDGERINTGKSYADYLQSISPYKQKV